MQFDLGEKEIAPNSEEEFFVVASVGAADGAYRLAIGTDPDRLAAISIKQLEVGGEPQMPTSGEVPAYVFGGLGADVFLDEIVVGSKVSLRVVNRSAVLARVKIVLKGPA